MRLSNKLITSFEEILDIKFSSESPRTSHQEEISKLGANHKQCTCVVNGILSFVGAYVINAMLVFMLTIQTGRTGSITLSES